MNDDDLLDAFLAEDFADPDLGRIDAAVDRLAPRLAVRRHRRWLVWLVSGLALAAAFALWLGWPPPPPSLPAPRPPLPTIGSTGTLPDGRLPPSTGPTPAPRPAPSASPKPLRRVVRAPPVEPAPLPAKQPGLEPGPDAEVRIDGDRAVLARGRLSFRRDASHDPTVSAVAIDDLPVTFDPVGTVFTVVAQPGISMIAVDRGIVEVIHDDGGTLATLVGPTEALVLDDGAAPSGVQVLLATGVTLDGLLRQTPAHCRCRSSDIVATIARLRLATRDLWDDAGPPRRE